MRPLAISLIIHAAILGLLVFHFPKEIQSGGTNVAVELGTQARSPIKPAEAADTDIDTDAETENRTASASATGTGSPKGAGGAQAVAEGDPYYAKVREKIEAHLHYPASFARRRIGGKLELELTLDPKGSLAGLTLAESSGTTELDQWVLDAVRKAAPFEAFQGASPRMIRLPISFLTR